jgi:hypothetical protein
MNTKKKGARKSDKETTPRNAQKGGQGAVGRDDPHAELDQSGHPGSGSEEKESAICGRTTKNYMWQQIQELYRLVVPSAFRTCSPFRAAFRAVAALGDERAPIRGRFFARPF